jgi:hypothetical protein
VKKYKARMERKGVTSEKELIKPQQLFNANMEELHLQSNLNNGQLNYVSNILEDKMIDEEYFGYDEGNEFHQKEGNMKDK